MCHVKSGRVVGPVLDNDAMGALELNRKGSFCVSSPEKPCKLSTFRELREILPWQQRTDNSQYSFKSTNTLYLFSKKTRTHKENPFYNQHFYK